jgi:hypothetical protein
LYERTIARTVRQKPGGVNQPIDRKLLVQTVYIVQRRTVREGETHEFSTGVQSEPGEDVVHVAFDGSDAHSEMISDRSVGQALANEGHDLAFPDRQP